MDLSKAKVLITGGSSGIGEATSRLLKSHGADVVIAGRSLHRLDQIAKEAGINYFVADITKEAEVIEMVKFAIKKMNGLNVLINNAGYGYIAPLLEIDSDEFNHVYQTNVLGAMLCARECAKYFVQQKYGNIINVGSTSAHKGTPGASPYVGTKHALKGMTESWRYELRKDNIRVMLVNPSEVMTNFAENRRTSVGKSTKTYSQDEIHSKLRADEIANAIAGILQLDDRAQVTEITVFATNPKD